MPSYPGMSVLAIKIAPATTSRSIYVGILARRSLLINRSRGKGTLKGYGTRWKPVIVQEITIIGQATI